MTLDEWKTLKSGMTIYRTYSSTPREIIEFDPVSLVVTLKAIRKTRYGNDFTLYSKAERILFSLQPVQRESIFLTNTCSQKTPVTLAIAADVQSGSELERLMIIAHVQKKPLRLYDVFVAEVGSAENNKRSFELMIGRAG